MAYGVRALVVDPVLVATSGDTLAGLEVSEAIKRRLFPLATVITPNVPEASAMLGECVTQCVDTKYKYLPLTISVPQTADMANIFEH